MHIAEGVLSGPVLLTGGAIAAAGTVVGLKRIDYQQVARVGILSASFFVASLIRFPIGPASIHLVLNGIVGIMLGWGAFPAILAALILQAVFFQYGGITTLGVNATIMALPALICYLLFVRVLRRRNRLLLPTAFVCGFLSVFLSALLTGAALMFTEEGFLVAAGTVAAAHFPVMVVEGLVTVFCLAFLNRVQPELLYGMPNQVRYGRNGTSGETLKTGNHK